MIKYLILIIIIFIILFNYKLIDCFTSISYNNNYIENKNILNNFFTNNRKLL